jgi:hypothetical protein
MNVTGDRGDVERGEDGCETYLVPLTNVVLVPLLEHALVVGNIVLAKDPAVKQYQHPFPLDNAIRPSLEKIQLLGPRRYSSVVFGEFPERCIKVDECLPCHRKD